MIKRTQFGLVEIFIVVAVIATLMALVKFGGVVERIGSAHPMHIARSVIFHREQFEQ